MAGLSPQGPTVSQAALSLDPRLLHSTGAVNVSNGVIGASGGSAGDSALYSIYIFANGSAVTLTVAGMQGEDGSARNLVFTGSTTVDTKIDFMYPLVNSKAAMTLTASVADKVLVVVGPG